MTGAQQKTLDFIVSYVKVNGYSPSYREIANGCGLRSISAVHERLESLAALGVIRHDERKPRAIQVLVAS